MTRIIDEVDEVSGALIDWFVASSIKIKDF